MEIDEKLAYCYWEFLAIAKETERLRGKGLLSDDELVQKVIVDAKNQLGLDEPIEQLMDKSYLDKIARTYGRDMENSPIPVFKAMAKAKAAANIDLKYMSFTEIVAKSRLNITPSYALQSWLRSRNTIAFLILWEKQYNTDFLADEAERLVAETDTKSSALTLKQWIPRTNAKGIVALQGRYGGTYAHPIIALDFEAWLSPERRFELFFMLLEYEKR